MDSIVGLYTVEPQTHPEFSPFQYYLDQPGKLAIAFAKRYLNINPSMEYDAFYQRPDGASDWIDPEITLRQQGIQDGYILGLVLANTTINIQYQGGQSMVVNSQVTGIEGYQSNYDPNQNYQNSLQYNSQNQENMAQPVGPDQTDLSILYSSNYNYSSGMFNSTSGFQSLVNSQYGIASGSDEQLYATGQYASLNFADFYDSDYDPSQLQSVEGDQNAAQVGIDLELNINEQLTEFQTMMGFGAMADQSIQQEGESITLETHYMFSERGAPKSYKLGMSQPEMLQAALTALGRYQDDKYGILLSNQDGSDARWVEPEKFLEDYTPNEKTHVYVIKLLKPIMVHSKHFKSQKLTLDISKKVSDLVADIATYFKIGSYRCYTLCVLNKNRKAVYLSINKSLPEQTRAINEVFFARQYYIFTLEDLETAITTEIAFKDVIDCVNHSEIEFTKEELLKYCAYRLMADEKFNIKKVPDDISQWMPARLAKKGKGAGRGPVLREFYQNNGTCNRFNAMRKFIKLCRKLVGFAERKYECYVTVTVGYKDYVLDPAVVYLSPYRLAIYDGISGQIEEKISYSEIVSVTTAQDLIIKFSPKRNSFQTYTFSGKGVEQMAKTISRYREITNLIFQDRSKRYATVAGNFKKLINKKTQINLYATDDISANQKEIKQYAFDKKFTGEIVKRAISYYLSIPFKHEKVILVHMMDEIFTFMRDTDLIQSLCLQNDMTLYLLEPKYKIRYTFPDGSNFKCETEITKTVDEIVPWLFQENHMQPMLGYTLWYEGVDKQLYPLDLRKTIPEQINYFRHLHVKRRFFILSKEVLQQTSSAIQALHDCRNYLNENDIKVDNDTALKLAMYSLYAFGVKNIRTTKHNLRELVPSSVSVGSSLEKKFHKMIQESEDMTQKSAAKKYIGLVRKIEGFGSESFAFDHYWDDFDPPREAQHGTFVITPLQLSILNAKGKPVVEKITYHSLKGFYIIGNNYIIKYQYPPKTGRIVYGTFTSDNVNGMDCVISYNLKIMRQVAIFNREMEKKRLEEMALRLSGGWKDEKGVVHGPMVDLRFGLLSDNILKPAQWFDIDTPQEELAKTLLAQLPHDPNTPYSTMVQVLKGIIKWLKPGMVLRDAQPYRESIVYFHPQFAKITFVNILGKKSTMQVSIDEPVSSLIPKVGVLFDITFCQGYTFFYKEDNKMVPLNTALTIPEQTRQYDTLYFFRYFFVINKTELTDHSALKILYYDAKDLILSGEVSMIRDVALELAAYSLVAESKHKPKKEELPEILEPLFPRHFKVNKTTKSELWSMIKHKPCKGHKDAMFKYIALARTLPTFGSISVEVTYVKFKKGTRADISALLVASPQTVRVVSEDLTRTFTMCEYRHFIKCETIANELAVKFSQDDSDEPAQILCILNNPEHPHAFINRTVELYNIFLDMRREGFNPKKEDVNTSIDRVVLKSKRWDDKKQRILNIAFDMRYTGEMVRKRAVRALHLEASREWTPLLKLTNDEYRWVHPKDILGHYFPCDNMWLTLYPTIFQIQVTYNDTTIDVYVNITHPLHQIIPILGECFNIEYPTGFTLYVDNPGKAPTPLDLWLSIPEQYTGKFEFLFIRRFLVFTHSDRFFPYICRSFYQDVKKNIMSGVPVTSDTKATELAIYSIYADNREKDPMKITIPPMDKLYPAGTDGSKIHEQYIMETIRNGKLIHRDIAMQKYIGIAKQTLHFGCTLFKVQMTDDQFILAAQEVTVSIGPLGVHIFGRVRGFENEVEKIVDLDEKITYNYVCDFSRMIDHLVVRVSLITGRVKTFIFTTPDVDEMFILLRSYKYIFYPYLTKREELQKVTPELQAILDNRAGLIDVLVSKRMFITDAPQFSISTTLDYESIIKVICYFLVMPYASGKYILVHQGQNNEYRRLLTTENLMSIDATDGDGLVLLEESSTAKFISISNVVVTKTFPSMTKVEDLLKDVCNEFGYGTWIGYTCWIREDEGDYIPLDIMKPLVFQANLSVPILVKRRYFLYSNQMLRDYTILSSVYNDCKYLVINRIINVSDDSMTQLIALSLYAMAENPSAVTLMVSTLKRPEWNSICPADFEISEMFKKKLLAFLTHLPVLEKTPAMFYYIGLIMDYRGFSEETYITNIHALNYNSQIIGKLCMNPWRITIRDANNDNNIIYNFSIGTILTNEIGKEKVMISALDQTEEIYFNIYSDDYKRIGMYIINLIYLYQLDEFQCVQIGTEGSCFINNGQRISLTMGKLSTIAFEEPIIQQTETSNEDGEDDVYLDDMDFMNHFEEHINNVEINIEDVLKEEKKVEIFDVPNIENIILDDTYKFNDKIDDIEIKEEDIVWRTNEEGLNISRAENLLNAIEIKLDLNEEKIVDIGAQALFQQLATINDQIGNFVDSTYNDDLRDQFSQIYTQIDSLVSTTQNLVQSNQDITPYVAEIQNKIQSTISFVKPTIERTENAKVQLIERIQDQQTFSMQPEVEAPPITKDLISISAREDKIANELLLYAASAGIDASPIIQSLQVSSSTLTVLAGTIKDAQSSSQFNIHIKPHIPMIASHIQKLNEIVAMAREKNVDLPVTVKSIRKLKELVRNINEIITNDEEKKIMEERVSISARPSILMERQSISARPTFIEEAPGQPIIIENVEQHSSAAIEQRSSAATEPRSSNASRAVSLPGDETILVTVDTLSSLDLNSPNLQNIPQHVLSLFSIANQSIANLKQLLINLSQSPANDALRFECISELSKVDADITDLITELYPYNSDQTAAYLYSVYYQVLMQIKHQEDLISSRNITSVTTSKITNDLAYLVNNQEAILAPDVLSKLDDQTQDRIKYAFNEVKTKYYDIQQAQSTLETNVADIGAVSLAQANIVELKTMLPQLQHDIQQLSAVSNDVAMPVIIERLAMDIDKAITEKPSENISNIPYILKFQESMNSFQDLISELVTTSSSDSVKQDATLNDRATSTLAKAKKIYLEMVDRRNDLIEDPYNDEVVNSACDIVKEAIESMNEIQVLSKRIVDVTNNVKIATINEEITSQLQDSLTLAQKQTSSAKLEEKKSMVGQNKMQFAKPTPEQIQAVIDCVTHLAQIVQYYITLPEVEDNDDLRKDAVRLYDYMSSVLVSLKEMGENLTDEVYEFVIQINRLAQKFQQIAITVPSFMANENADQLVPYGLQMIANVQPVVIQEEAERPKAEEIIEPEVSPEVIKAKLAEVSQSLGNFSQKIVEVQNSVAESPNNEIVNRTLNDWTNSINATIERVNAHLQSPQFSLKQAKLDKETLIQLQKKVNLVPMNVRKAIDLSLVSELNNNISEVMNKTNVFVSAVRNIPTAKKVEIMVENVPVIKEDDDIEDTIVVVQQQAEMINNVLNQIESCGQIDQSPSAKALVSQIRQNMQAFSTDRLNAQDEKVLIQQLNSIKNEMPKLISNAELIEPMVDSSQFTDLLKTFNDSSGTIAKIISVPHMNKATATKFIQHAHPQLQQFVAQLTAAAQTPEVAENPQLKSQFDNLIVTASNVMKDLPTLKPRQAQIVCDDLYSATCALLPTLYDSNFDQLEEATQNVALVSEVFTSLPKTRKPKSYQLILKEPVMAQNNIISAIKESCDIIMEGGEKELPQEYIASIVEDLNAINDHKDALPNHVLKSINIYTPQIKEGNTHALVDVVRLISQCETDYETRNQLLSDVATAAAVNAAQQVIELQNTIKVLHDKITQSPDKFSNETKYYDSVAQSSVKESDAKLLTQTKSFASAMVNRDSLNDASQAVSLLLDTLKNNEQVKDIVNPVAESNTKLISTLHQFDMCLGEMLLSQLDRIVTACDNSIIQNPGASSPAVKSFVRQTYALLKNANRSIAIGPSELNQFSNLYEAFNKTVVPTLTTMPNNYKEEIAAALKTITPIQPLINTWKTPIPLTGKQELRNAIRSSAVQIEDIADSLVSVDQNMSDVLALSQSLQIATLRAKAAGIDVSRIEPIIQNCVKAQKSFEISNDAKDFEKVKEAVNAIKNCAEALKTEITMVVPITELNENATAVKLVNAEIYLPTIADASCLNVAKSATVVLNQYRTKLDTLQKTAKPTIIQTKASTPELIAKQTTENTSTISVALNPIISITTAEVPTIMNNIAETTQLGTVVTSSVPVQQQGKLVESNLGVMLAQRIEGLRQKQLDEFPDIVKMLDKPIDVKLNEDAITNAMMSIQQQSQLLNDPVELKKTISRLTPDEIIVQQHALKLMTENILEKQVDTNITEAAQTFQMKQTELLEAVANAQTAQEIKLKTVEDVNRSVQRGFSAVNLVETLQALQQLVVAKVPELCKYVRSPEGQQLLKAPIAPTKLVDVQQKLIQLVNIADSPEQLDVVIHNTSPEDMVTTMRMIDASLNVLASDDVYNMIADTSVETTPVGLLKSTNNKIIEAIKTNESASKMNALIQTETTLKAQDFVVDALQRFNLAQSLVAIQQFHTNCLPQLQQKISAIDVSQPVDRQLVDTYTQMITQQLEYINHPQEFAMAIPQLRIEDLENQQAVISNLAATLATSKSSDIKYDLSALKNTTAALLDKVHESVSDKLADDPEQLHLVKVNNEKSVEFFHQHQQLLNTCQQTLEMGNVLQVIRQKVPNIDQMLTSGQANQILQANLNEQKLTDAKDKMLALQHSTREGFTSLADAVNDVKVDDLVVIFSLMSTQMIKMKDLDNVVNTVKSKSMESRIFDKSLLIQQTKRKVDAKKLVPDAQKVDAELADSMKDLAQAQLCSNIADLLKLRTEIAEVSQTDKTNAIKNIQLNPDKLAQLQQQTYQQLYQISINPDQVKQQVKQEDKESQAAQTLLLQHLSMAAASPQYMAASCKDVDFSKTAQLNQASQMTALTVNNATQISGKLIGFQRALLQQNPAQLAQIAAPSITTVDAISTASKENLQRLQLRTKMSAIQRDLIASNPQIIQAISAIAGKPQAQSLDISTDEIKEYQGEMKLLVSTNSAPTAVKTITRESSNDKIVKKLAVLNNLIQITKPSTPVVTTFSNIAGLDSILNTNLNIDVATVSAAPLATKNYRSELNSVANAAQTASDVIPILSQFSHLPISECKNIFAKTNTEAIQLVEKLMKTKSSQETDQLVMELSKLSPKLIASLARNLVLVTDQKIRAMLVTDPAQLLQVVNEIITVSTDLSNTQSAQRFRQMCTVLFQALKNFDAALVNVQSAKTEPIKSFEKLVKAIDTNDLETISRELIDFSAMKVKRMTLNEQAADLDPIIDQIVQIDKAVQKYYIADASADQQLSQVLQTIKANSIQILKRETPNVFVQVGELADAKAVDLYFNAAKTEIDDASTRLIEAIQARNKDKQQDCINLIIKNFASCQSAMYRGFSVSNQAMSASIATDYITMIYNSTTATRNIIDITKMRAVSSTMIKRATRSYNRIIDSMSSMLQESHNDEEQKTPWENAKCTFIQSLSNTINTLSSTLATITSSKIPDVTLSILSSEKANFDKLLPQIMANVKTIKEINTNKQAEADFSDAINELSEAILGFQKEAYNVKSTVDITAAAFVTVVDKTLKVLNKTNTLTDVVPRTPDIESADMLPKSFDIPPVPDVSSTDISACYNELQNSIAQFNEKNTIFFQIVNHPQATNQYIVQSFTPYMQQMQDMITRVLACSATCFSISHQSYLADAAGALTVNFAQLINSLKDRFLLRGDFDGVSKAYSEKVFELINGIISASSEANEQAASANGELSAIRQKLHPAVSGLGNVKHELEAMIAEIKDQLVTRFSELSRTTINEPCTSITSATQKLLILACGKLNVVENVDKLAEKSMTLLEALNEAIQASRTIIQQKPAIPEATIAPVLSKVAKSGKELSQIKTLSLEATKLAEAIAQLCEVTQNLAATTEATAKRKSAPKTGQNPSGGATSHAVKSNLLKRLELEAKVIRARTLLEKYEKDLAKLG